MKQPTIDRENNDGNYCLENCRFIEKSENSTKDKYKQVNQYDAAGNFIRTWKSGWEVQRVLGIANSNISRVCIGKRKTAGGYIWKFKKEITI